MNTFTVTTGNKNETELAEFTRLFLHYMTYGADSITIL